MTVALIMLRQIAIMALLILVGIFLSRKAYLSEQGTKDLGAVLIRVVIPAVIIKSYITPYSQQRLLQLGQSALLALIACLLAMLISALVFGKRHRLENFAASFCNAGFIGIPLVQAAIGEDGVFLVAAMITLLNLFQWTYGVFVMTGNRDAVSAKAILKNPVVAALTIGLVIFLTQLPVPPIVVSTLGYISGINTPVAMILLGTYLAKLPLRRILLEKRAYLCVLFRLAVIPLATLLGFKLIPIRDTNVLLAVFLSAATPVGTNICIYAQQYDCDYEYSVITVCLSTLLSAATVPLLVAAAHSIL